MVQLALRSFYESLYEYEKKVDLETIEALARCVLRNSTREELRDTVRNRTYEQVLDVGCGIGFNLIVLLKYADIRHVIGADVASGAVRIAKKRMARQGMNRRVDFVICDAQALPLKESMFDLVVCTEVLEHLYDDVKAVTEISRVTRENSDVFVSVPSSRNTFKKYIAKTQNAQNGRSLIRQRYFGLQTGGDLRSYELKHLTDLLDLKSIRIVRFWFNGRFFYSLSVWLNSAMLSLARKLLKFGDIHGDFVRETARTVGSNWKLKKLLNLYSRTIIPFSNAILSLDTSILKFNYGGNLTVKARREA